MDVWFWFGFLFFSKEDYLVYKLFSRHTLVKDRTYTYFGPKKFLKKFAHKKSLFNAFPFRKLSSYKTVSGNLAKSDDTPKRTLFFFFNLYLSKNTETFVNNIFSNMLLL